ncbi:MAG TPA: VacJ family lipoprotein [Noviherbaspirillum sp.]|nr:VacJ family lipoprotein [Noviherbaspirillum sp.]
MMRMLRLCAPLLALLAAGCATTHPDDPFEHYNRVAFGFNRAVDDIALRPAAEVYTRLPSFMQTGVYNFFGNLQDVNTAANNFLQGKWRAGISDVTRVGLNTSLGIAGLFDVASEAGLQKNYEDFGQTLGKWGMESGPYVVLPLLGPSTLRDTLATPVDFQLDPWYYKRPARYRNAGVVLRTVDQRATLLDASTLLEEAALDRYQFVRDAYLQRRRNQVYDGDPPPLPRAAENDE